MAVDRPAPRITQTQFNELLQRLAHLESRMGGATRQTPGPAPCERLPVCAVPAVKPRVFGPDVTHSRARLIETNSRKWVNGTVLHYWFFHEPPYAPGNDHQKDLVREAFDVWSGLGIGVRFSEIDAMSEAEVRIGFLQGDGSWSFIGRDVIDVAAPGERTMNFGWDLLADPRGVDVPVHEIGHTLGFPHEHQNPFSGIVWNEKAVYDYFGAPPNSWDHETTLRNIIQKLSSTDVAGTQWDPDSIMHYAFAAGLIDKPDAYRTGLTPAGGLSQRDREQAQRFYPALNDAANAVLRPLHSEPLGISPAQQKNFVIAPDETRKYTMQTFGESDVVMALFEDAAGELKFVAGDDDSGTPRNSSLQLRLMKGRRYVLRIRMIARPPAGEVAAMIW